MSAFATVRWSDDFGWTVDYGRESDYTCGSETEAKAKAARINAAHADRVAAELEAAADDVSESDSMKTSGLYDAAYDEACVAISDRLRARAKAIREGGGK